MNSLRETFLQGKGLAPVCVLLLLFIFPFAPDGVLAQAPTGSITGTVTEAATGDALIGANIILQGTRLGASTDREGRYTILNVQAGTYTLVVSFIGYFPQEREITIVNDRETTADFALEVSALNMDEVVVTGTGSELRKKELTTPISTLSSSQIERAPVETLDQLLNGRITGGKVNINTGMPGTSSRVRTRGITSANVSQTPIIYVDGVRVDVNDNFRMESTIAGTGGPVSSALSDLLVADIDHIEVTKGGAASTLYGSEAASGVIQIFTKKGTAGAPQWSFKTEQGINQPDNQFLITQFAKDLMKSRYYQRNSISVQGGTEEATYHLSGSFKNEKFPHPNLENTVYNLQAGVRAFMSEKMEVEYSFSYSRDNFTRVFSDNASEGILGTVESGGFGTAWDFNDDAIANDAANRAGAIDYTNNALTAKLTEWVNRMTTGATMKYRPFDYFSNKLTLGVDYRKSEARQLIPRGLASPDVFGDGADGAVFRSDREYLTVTLDYSGTYNYSPLDDFTSYFTFGAQGFRVEDRESGVDAEVFGLPGTDDFDNAANLDPQESNRQLFNGGFYFNEQIGWKDKVFLNAGIRFDDNSAFGDAIDIQKYPKAGLAYTISDESFWNPVSRWIDEFKVRASWGKTGKFPDPYEKDKTFLAQSFLEQVSVSFDNPGDPKLGPEKTTTYDLGFDAALWQNRIAIEFSYFNEKTEDALFLVPREPTTGLGRQLRNVGTIENKGIELGVDATIFNRPNFSWNVGFNFSTLDNKITDLGGSPPFSIGGFQFLPLRVEQDKPVGVFRTNEPTSNGDYDTVTEKSPVPDKYGSIFTDVSLWGKLRLSALADWQTGGYSLNTGSVLRYFWGGEPQASLVPDGYDFQTASGVFIVDSDYLKLREISASYDLTDLVRIPNVKGLSLIASVRNIYTWHKIPNSDMDPELNGIRSGVVDADVGGINFNTIPPPRMWRFSLKLDL